MTSEILAAVARAVFGVVAQAEHDQRIAQAGVTQADAALVHRLFLLLRQRPGGRVEHVVEHAHRRFDGRAESARNRTRPVR